MADVIMVERPYKRRVYLERLVCQGPNCSKNFVGAPSRKYCSRACQRRQAYHVRRDKLSDLGEKPGSEHVQVDWAAEGIR